MMQLYRELLEKHGRQEWWPCRTKNRFEICAGAVLTQGTSWKNVEKAISNMAGAQAMGAAKIAAMPMPRLERLVRPSGFFRQKARRLKALARFVSSYGSFAAFAKNATRDALLEINGIGKETADAILLYACGRPYFVVDAYTRRLLSARRMISGNEEYDEIRELFEKSLPRSVPVYGEFHALIVEEGKLRRSNPVTS
ncbi:MAG: endonuclease [Candidatus Aenigmarchaeota archaeon]|nr:endonuclease [Candidatus Aenigmarchaeota archaeon]